MSRIYEGSMKTTIRKWGDSLAAGKLVTGVAEPTITLESLVEEITDGNRHGEIGTGQRVENEVW